MVNNNTKMVQVLKNQNNPMEMFNQWSENHPKTNTRCSNTDCSNDANGHAYMVETLVGREKYIIPVCALCYASENSKINHSSFDFHDYGSVITVEKDLLTVEILSLQVSKKG